MNLSNLKTILPQLSEILFQFEDGTTVPAHFHVTEIGQISKKFIDCGGTIRHENKVNFQLWTADDLDHRLAPSKLLDIIALSEKHLNIEDAPIEVEYQGTTIMTFDLEFENGNFILKRTKLCEFGLEKAEFLKHRKKVFFLKDKNENGCGNFYAFL